MKNLKMGVTSILAGLLAACASAPPSDYGVQPTDVNVSQNNDYRYGEIQIAVNPRNPNNIVIATHAMGSTTACYQRRDPNCESVEAHLGTTTMRQLRGFFEDDQFNRMHMFASFDRGRTWTVHTIPPSPRYPHMLGQGDPSVTVTPDGTFYASFDLTDWGTPENALPSGGVGVSISRDGGRTWSEPVLSGTPMDGPKITADPVTGRVYANSSSLLGPRADGNPNSPMGTYTTRWIAATNDGRTWTPPRAIGGAASVSAAHGVVAAAFRASAQTTIMAQANGELCVGVAPPCTIFQTSQDDGATWTRHVVRIPNDYSGSVMTAADPSRPGRFAVGVLRNGAYNIYVTTDSGVTWSAPAIVTDDASKQHFLPWMTYSPVGVLGIVWRTRQTPAGGAPAPQPGNAPAPVPYNSWAAISRDGGTTFSQPMRMSREDSPAGQPAASGDDYSGIALDRDYLYAGWADWRPGERQNYVSAVRLDSFSR